MNQLSIVFDNTLNDLKANDGRVSVLTQITLIFFLMTLTFTSGSIQHYLAENLNQLLGSDLVLESHTPLTSLQQSQLAALSSGVSKTSLNEIVLTNGERSERAQLKLVDDNYPLQGILQIGSGPAAQQVPSKQPPNIGEIWLGPRLATKLGLSVGDIMQFGNSTLRVAAILFHEPDRIMEGHSVALRAMVHERSVLASALGTSSWRVRHLIAANPNQRKEIEAWSSQMLPDATIIKKEGGQHPLANFWKRTENFLGLASVILFFMGAVALDMTNRRWLANMRYRLAIYASLGTPLHKGAMLAAAQWFLGFLLAMVIAILLSLTAHTVIIGELQSVFPDLQPVRSWPAGLRTMGLALLLFVVLQVPSFMQLRHASLISLIRTTAEDRYIWQRLLWGVGSVSILAAAYSDNMLLTGMTLAAISGAILLMIAISWMVMRLGDLWGRNRTGLLPFAFFMMRRRLFSKSAQILGLGLCGLLLLFTLMLMRDLGGALEGYRRTHDGNLLISEAQEEQIDAVRQWASDTGSNLLQLRPFLSAKLIAVNQLPLSSYMEQPSDSGATLQRSPVRLSWSQDNPKNNRLISGNWWDSDTKDWQQISVVAEVMTDLSLDLGDTLTFQISGKPYDFAIAASHAYRAGGGSITFWFRVPTSAKDQIQAPSRFMGSMELPANAWSKLSGLWQRHPTLLLVSLQELTERFDKTREIVIKISSGYAGMVLLLALFVLVASVSGFRDDDRLKNGLLMSMGLRTKDCLWLNFYDWGVTALIAAAGAIAGTWLAGLALYQAQFGLTYNPDILWIAGTLAAMVTAVCLVGYAACHQSLRVSVRDLMTT